MNCALLFFTLIYFRCINRQDKTVKILSKPQDKKTFTWQVESFKFFGKLGDKIYIQCDALVCTSTSTDPRCRRCGVVGRRRRRDVADLGDTISKNFHTQPVSVRTGLIVLVKENGEKLFHISFGVHEPYVIKVIEGS